MNNLGKGLEVHVGDSEAVIRCQLNIFHFLWPLDNKTQRHTELLRLEIGIRHSTQSRLLGLLSTHVNICWYKMMEQPMVLWFGASSFHRFELPREGDPAMMVMVAIFTLLEYVQREKKLKRLSQCRLALQMCFLSDKVMPMPMPMVDK